MNIKLYVMKLGILFFLFSSKDWVMLVNEIKFFIKKDILLRNLG